MPTTRCYGCGAPLRADNDSKAHIIPNALGGHLAPRGLICKECNNLLDTIADNALINAFGEWPTLLGIPRQRGKNPSHNTHTQKGDKVRINSDGSLTKTDVIFKVTPVDKGDRVQISAGDTNIVKQLIRKAKKQFPQINIEEVERHLQKVKSPLDDEIATHLNFGNEDIMGGIVSALWLFYLYSVGQPIMKWDRLLQCIDGMKQNGGTFRYFDKGLPGLSGPAIDLGHKIVLRSVPATGDLIAYVEILSALKVGGVFAKGKPGNALELIYVYDVVEKADLSDQFSIDPQCFDTQNWTSVGLGSSDISSLKKYRKQTESILKSCYYQLNQ